MVPVSGSDGATKAREALTCKQGLSERPRGAVIDINHPRLCAALIHLADPEDHLIHAISIGVRDTSHLRFTVNFTDPRRVILDALHHLQAYRELCPEEAIFHPKAPLARALRQDGEALPIAQDLYRWR
jgi:hypothetical protein